jgi:alpha-L-fucosidase 2
MNTLKQRIFTISIIILLLVTSTTEVWSFQISEKIDNKNFDPATFMWYTSPAEDWEDALPVGNGRLGAMVFGGVDEERIQFNEDTYYSGGPYNSVVKGGYKILPEIQELLFKGKPIEAHKLFGRHLLGYPVEQQKYQCLGNLHLFYKKGQDYTNYKRWLVLSTGITGSSYDVDGVTYTREVLSSHPDQLIAIRIRADRPGMISFEAELRGTRNIAHSNYGTDYFRMDGESSNELVLKGRSADYLGIESKLRYEARVRFDTEGGKVTRNDSRIKVENANVVIIYLAAATNFVSYKDVSADEALRVKEYFSSIGEKKYEEVKEDAISDYQNYFNRVQLNLEATATSYLPTDIRMDSLQNNPDPLMAALTYQFGRFLLIASSRPGTQPANLQGIWNEDENPWWDAKYTTNINTQMNYWPVESANLPEMHEPLFKMIEELTDQGSQVAKEHYGANGWVFHQNTDLWRVAAPMDGAQWGTFTVGGAWLVTHMWEHYLFTQDKVFLERIYPAMKGCVDFFMDFLVEHPNGKWLVTNPSNSPENPPEGPGYKYFFDEVIGWEYFTTIVYGSTIDMQILKDLFSYYMEAAEILGKDKNYAINVEAARKQLVPSQIGKDGTLQEWTEDYGQLEDNHRHFSHLYGLYPGNVLSARRTPEFIEPIKKVLYQRGDGGLGFSRTWKMALWARLYDGEKAFSIYKGYLKEQCHISLFAMGGPKDVFLVEGALGATAAISEMIVQSHEGVIDLLPALPGEWSSGEFKGVCVRGGFELDMKWKDKTITSVDIHSKSGQACALLAEGNFKVLSDGKEVETQMNKGGFIQFKTLKGETYQLRQF